MKKLINIYIAVAFLSQITNAQLEFSQNNIPFRDLSREYDRTLTILDSAGLDSFIIATMDQYHIPGVSACIVREGDVYWTGVYGYSNIEQNQPVTDSTTFTIGSISKTFTATALMQLWEEGLFGLDDHINNYLPPELQISNPLFPDESITFRQLLTHTSSIDNDFWYMVNFTSIITWGSDSPVSLDSFLVNCFVPGGSYYSLGPFNNWAPGAQWEYSNVAIASVAYLVEAIANTPFSDYCQENIFTPLGMHETSWFLDGLDTSNIAVGYSYTNNYVPYEHYGVPIYPASNLRTSATQLAQFLTSYIQGGEIDGIRILESATVDSMMTVQCLTAQSFILQGLVWRISYNSFPALGTKTYASHTGAMPGYRAGMIYLLDPENPIGAIVLTNGESLDAQLAIWEQLTTYGYFNKRIYAQNVELSSPFMHPNVDTLTITTQFVNTENHSFTANAVITRIDSTIVETVQLFDDGNHHDGSGDDGLWGGYILPLFGENEFLVDVGTVDLESGNNLVLEDLVRFTTIGPVVFDSVSTPYDENPPTPGSDIYFQITLRNEGSTATATEVIIEITTDMDSLISILGGSVLRFGDIPAGDSVTSVGFLSVRFNNDFPVDSDIIFNLEMTSEDFHFWSDSFTVHVYPLGIAGEEAILPDKYALHQNYPNPFNPVTTIQYNLPVRSDVQITIFDLLGREVTTLVSETQEAGYKSVNWDATNIPSGMYFYQIRASDFLQTRKMILLK